MSTQETKGWRKNLGFTNQDKCEDFLGGKDIRAKIDETYLNDLNERLEYLVEKINCAVHEDMKLTQQDLKGLLQLHRDETLAKLKSQKLLPLLNNQGRRPEKVYFNWMRGYLAVQFFRPAMEQLFAPLGKELIGTGADNFNDIQTFKRSATADLAVTSGGKRVAYIEVQSGYSAIHDLKLSKWEESQEKYKEEGIKTFVVHFDVFNGRAAVVDLSRFCKEQFTKERKQFEGAVVMELDDSQFLWRLQGPLPASYEELIPE